MEIEKKAREYYNELGSSYLDVWRSTAKQAISAFEVNLVLSHILPTLGNWVKPKILEVGAGPGRITKHLLALDCDYYGVDISEKMIRSLKEKFGNNSKVCGVEQTDIGQRIPFGGTNFEYIVVMRSLYYSNNWKEIIANLKSRLSPNGVLIFCMPNHYSSALLGKICSNHPHAYYTAFRELTGVLRNCGFSHTQITSFARLPDVLYDWADNRLMAKTLLLVERFLRILLGETLLARMFYVAAVA